MALASKKNEKFYVTTGTGKDKADSAALTKAETTWDLDKAEGNEYFLNHPDFSSIIYQLQQMQDDIDELRRYVVSNEVLPVSGIASGLPTSSKNLTSGTLYSDRGIIKVV
tara:strand:- start:1069 stop:1398 length:330 start_codon:yes stop_codon:yes gene_type:complete